MISKKRRSSAVEELDGEEEKQIDKTNFGMKNNKEKIIGEKDDSALQRTSQPLNPMEKKKKRKQMDKAKHQIELDTKGTLEAKTGSESVVVSQMQLTSGSALPEFHLDVFQNLASADSAVREAAAETLVTELIDVQKAYEQLEKRVEDEGNSQLEADGDDCLEGCAPSLRYAIRRLIRGVSSSRECARQGFSLGLAVVVEMIHAVRVESVMKLIVSLLEVSSSMKGQEARDCYLGRLFAYGSLARSYRLSTEWISNKNTSVIMGFTSTVISLSQKRRYLHEPAVPVLLDMLEKLPSEAMESHVLIAPGIQEWLQKAVEIGDPDALYFSLKLQERVEIDRETFVKLLPHPFNIENFFSRENLQHLGRCFTESTFCLPRLHSIWHILLSMLIPDGRSQLDAEKKNSMKIKKSRKCSSSEDIIKNIRCFGEVVIEGTLLQSSHDRKYLALGILQLLLPRIPSSCINSVLSHKLVHCLMDILSTKNSWLYKTAQLFVKELLNWAAVEDDRQAAVIIALQNYSNCRFDCTTRTNAVREMVSNFRTAQGCLHFVHKLMSLFMDEAAIIDEPSDQSQTTDENSEMGSVDDKGSLSVSGNTEYIKNWVIVTMPRVLKNLKVDVKLDPSVKKAKVGNSMEEKFKLQTEIAKFLSVQGLFSATLGTEVTSFELQEKFKWPKLACSSSLCKLCVEQLQLLLENAQKEESGGSVNNVELNDLGSYVMCFLKTLCSIPSVSLCRTLSMEDKTAFNRLQAIESRLYQEERNIGPGLVANKLHALRYLLIQLVVQIILHPNDFSEAALDLVICCKKLFPSMARSDSSEDEDAYDENDMPKLMDVFVETLLSILPHTSSRLCYAVEQVFRFFCSDITDYGLQRMLLVVKKDIKPLRHPASSDDDDDEEEDDEVIEIEDAEMDEANAHETREHEVHEHDTEKMVNSGEALSSSGEESEVDELLTGGDDPHKFVKIIGDKAEDPNCEASDDSDGGMDDDAMFRLDAYHAQLLKEHTGNDNALSQLTLFKLRVLSLLEIYVRKYPGRSHALSICSCLVQTYSKYHGVKGNEQLGQRIIGILQKKIFRGRDYPRGDDIPFDTLEKLLEKSLKIYSRSRVKDISSLTQAFAFWLLKIVSSRDFSEPELARIVQIFKDLLADYFDNRNSRLKSGFIKEIIRRHHWLGLKLFDFLLEKCGNVKAEFRRIEAVGMVECIIKSVISSTRGKNEKEASSKSSKPLKAQLPVICNLILQLLNNLPGKQSRRAEVRRFCTGALKAVTVLKLKKSFMKAMTPDGISVCESKLGNVVAPFKAL